MTKHILVAGYYGFHNSGDEAILRVLISDLRRAEAELSVCILSGDPKATRRMYDVDAIAHGDIAGIIEQARRSDALIVGGGGIFLDYWGAQKNTILTSKQAGLPFYCNLPLLGQMLEKPVLLYAVGVGPLFSAGGEELTRLAFKLAPAATVRDSESLEILQFLGVPTKKIRITADPAFNIQADNVRAREILDGLSVDRNRPIVGVCLRNWEIGVEPSTWQAETAAGLDEFAKRTGCTYIFLPFQDLPDSPLTQDTLAANAVIQQMKHQQDCLLVPAQEDPAVTAGILSTCGMVVGMRYHSIVFAACAGVPPVALAYDPKVAHLMGALGLEDLTIHLADITGAALVSRMNQAWENRPFHQKQLAGKVASLKRLAAGNYQAVRRLLEGGSTHTPTERDIDQFVREFALQQSLALAEQEILSDNLQGQLSQEEQDIKELNTRIQEKDKALDEKDRQIQTLNIQMNGIYRSRGWKLMSALWNLRKRLIPPDSKRERVARSIWRKLQFESNHPARRLFQPPFPFNERYIEEDNSLVTVYTDDPLLFPGYPALKPLRNSFPDRLKVSLIASVKNEADNIAKWMKCIESQTRLPDEIIILDGGSTDGSDRQLEEWGKQCPIPVRIIRAPGTNIARGRNIAIQEAHHPIVAVTDFGCEAEPDWLEKLIQPFKLEPETRVAAGFYECVDRTGQVLSGNGLWPGLGQVDPQAFLPSSRSVAFQKEALDAAGGHPEWLSMTGDDTYLDLELKRLGGKWAFVPEAQVKWEVPEKLGDYLGKMYQWASGDGESGVHARYYWNHLLRLTAWLTFSSLITAALVGVVIWQPTPTLLWAALCCMAWIGAFAGLSIKEKLPLPRLIQKSLGQGAQVLGYLEGTRNWKEVARRRKSKLVGVFFILSGVPINDSGGGARGTQIANELLQSGWGVVFLHKFERDETRNLQISVLHPNLFLMSIEHFKLEEFNLKQPELLTNRLVRVLIEFPLPDFLPIVKQLREEYEAAVVYDLLDNWNTSLGSRWYSTETEKQIIQASTHLAATLPGLAKRLETISGRKPLILPNAVNTRLFDPHLTHHRPDDLPAGTRILIYVGALWGDWFDWDLLGTLADASPEAQIVLIGDYRGQAPYQKSNVHFLGLKAQKDLPAYLAHADAALIPWKVSNITQATSPLKIYEYLAMLLPVVAPSLEPLKDMPGVFPCDTREEFLRLAGTVTRQQLDEETLSRFIGQNNWTGRVDELLKYLGGEC